MIKLGVDLLALQFCVLGGELKCTLHALAHFSHQHRSRVQPIPVPEPRRTQCKGGQFGQADVAHVVRRS